MKTFAKFALSLCLAVMVSLFWMTDSLVASATPLSVGTTLAAASTQSAVKVDFIGLNSSLNTKAEVKAIQEALNKVATKAGFKAIQVDGVFGPNTEKAVKKFQEHKGLLSDGKVGKRTVTALEISWKSLPKLAQALGIPSNVA